MWCRVGVKDWLKSENGRFVIQILVGEVSRWIRYSLDVPVKRFKRIGQT